MGNFIENLIDFCARNKMVVLILVALAVVGGIFAIKNVSLDAIPDLSDTQVIVFSRWDRPPQVHNQQRLQWWAYEIW